MRDAHVTLGTLDEADNGTVKPGIVSEPLLGQPTLNTKQTEVNAELAEPRYGPLSPCKVHLSTLWSGSVADDYESVALSLRIAGR